MNNRSAWPARVTKELSWRYFIDLSELIANGYSVDDITVSLISNPDKAILTLQPWHVDSHIYYIEVLFADTAIYPGYEIPPYYDSMIAKLISYGADRTEAISRMERALSEFVIDGIPTTINFHKAVMENEKFKKGIFYTNFLEDEFDHIIELSALTKYNLNLLLDALFEILPKGKPFTDLSRLPTPLLNSNSKIFISELIREKAFLNLRKELPYSLTTVVDEISERDNGTLFIKGRIITDNDRYKGMIIGTRGKMIKEIGIAVRKELEVSTDKKAFIDLSVEVNPHWEKGF